MIAGLDVPSKTLAQVSAYLDLAGSDGGSRYAYQPGDQPDKVMTAEGLLCRELLGWPKNAPNLLAGADFVVSNLPRWAERDAYYWYHATQMLHHLGGEHWKRWNSVLKPLLVKNQEQSGPERGSWNPLGGHSAGTGAGSM